MTASYRARAGSQEIDLPVVALDDDLSIALLMTIDVGIAFVDRAGEELADLLSPLDPQVVVTAATLGIPVAIAVARALGRDDYVVLQKSPKKHLAGSPGVTYTSITSHHPQTLTLDARRLPALAGQRVVFVDDVISSGASAAAAVALLTRSGAHVVAVGAVFTEGDDCAARLPAGLPVLALGQLPGNVKGHPDLVDG